MSIRGSCLCGGVRFEIDRAEGPFEIDRAEGPFEICHCNRCRKVSGSTGMAGLGVRTRDFRLLAGEELVRFYEAPLLYQPPAYRVCFCSRCGSPVPEPHPDGERFEIPAGLLDDDPRLRPDKHIFVELLPDWDEIADDLPQLTLRDLVRERHGDDLPPDFELRTHRTP